MILANTLSTVLTRNHALKSKFIIAVSGGKDSMCLLHACKNMELDIVAAHCNFMLRADESDADEAFVDQYCFREEIRLEKIRFNTKKESNTRRLSTQETARILRYEWFEELRVQHQADYVLTAHHGNDTVETFIINLLRGSGVKGLTGIPEKNGSVMRPLLGIFKNDIDLYASILAVPFRNDSSNESDLYTRNYIRHNVIPLFENINKQALQHILNTSSLLKENNELANELLDELTRKYTTKDEHVFSIDLSAITDLKFRKTALFFWLNPYGFNSTVIDDILLKHSTGKRWESDTHQAIYERGNINIVTLNSSVIGEQIFDHTLPADITFGNHSYAIDISAEKSENLIHDAFFIDASLVHFPVTLRPWKHGDRFTPLGMKNSKKLSDFFIDLKLSASQKKQAMIVESNNEIVAVIPHRVSDKFKLTDKTSHFLQIVIK